MAYPPSGPAPPMGMFPMPPVQPGAGLLPMPTNLPPMPPGMHPPVPMGLPPPMQPMPPHMQSKAILSAPPVSADPKQPKQRIPVVPASVMKVATTVFVGNISDKASDTLVRQILLKCGRVEGWKRVQDASGKLQAFGFCEYAEPESTLRAIRLLHDYKLGDKKLVVKVDAKTRTDLLKYLIRKKGTQDSQPVDEAAVAKEVEEIEAMDGGAEAFQELDEETKSMDSSIEKTIGSLVRDNIDVLTSSKSSEEAQLEMDVKESMLSMAKQCGKVDPDTTLDDMEMEENMKALIGDEIKKFRESYQRDDSVKQKKVRDKEKDRDRDRDKGKEDREKDRDKDKAHSPRREKERDRDRERERVRSPRRERSRSPIRKRSRSPPRSRSQERAERERRRERDRQREREESLKEEEEYEEKLRNRKMKDRERAYRDRLQHWESRERRKTKEHEREFDKERERKDEQERERRHLAEFLEDYDDERDDHRYYKANAYARRRREREMELDEDKRDQQREREEIETLRLEVMERQHRQKVADRDDEDESKPSSLEHSPHRREEEEDMDVHVREVEEDIPLTKPGYSVPSAYPPIQVQAAPAVQAPEVKDYSQDKAIGDGRGGAVRSLGPLKPVTETEGQVSVPGSTKVRELIEMEAGERAKERSESPQIAPKLTFGLRKSSASSSSASLPMPKKPKLETIFNTDDDDMEQKPKKVLVPIDYSDEEQTRDGVGAAIREQIGAKGEKKISPEERKKLVQSLVSSIPTDKEEVFEYQLKWEAIDKNLMDKRICPWINKKIIEYIGEEEPTLTEFICNKLACHIAPRQILSDIAMVLDEEAEVFVVKLWRLLIYETEAKHLGIAKSY